MATFASAKRLDMPMARENSAPPSERSGTRGPPKARGGGVPVPHDATERKADLPAASNFNKFYDRAKTGPGTAASISPRSQQAARKRGARRPSFGMVHAAY